MPNISVLLQKTETENAGIKGLTSLDYAFMLMRAIVITGGFFWLILHPYPHELKSWLFSIFTIFIIYSIVMYIFVTIWHEKIEAIYLVGLSLDLAFSAVFIKMSGGFNSVAFLVFYPLVALHSFYYGLTRGILLAVFTSLVYLAAIYDHWFALLWTELILRLSVVFLLAGFLGFISEKEKYNKDELVNTHVRLESVQRELQQSYKTLQDVKTQVEQSEKLASIGRLSSELAHEINNPLDGIKNCLSVIKQENTDTETRRRYFELIDDAVYDIESSVRGLLEYARIHAPHLEEVDISCVVKRTLVMTDYKLKKAGIAVKTEFDFNAPFVMADPHQMQEVFFNIIINAIDAMPGGGSLKLKTGREGNSVVIKIHDTGGGIAGEDIDKIFQPFFTTKPLGEGTGLGLPVSLEIVKKHKGDIRVESVRGVGSTFSIFLPVSS